MDSGNSRDSSASVVDISRCGKKTKTDSKPTSSIKDVEYVLHI